MLPRYRGMESDLMDRNELGCGTLMEVIGHVDA